MGNNLFLKLLNSKPSYCDPNEIVDANNLYTYEDVVKLIKRFYGTEMNAYKASNRKESTASKFILNNKDLTLKICVDPYTCKVYRVKGIDDESEIPDVGFEKYWQRILIKRNGQSYFDELEKYYFRQIEQIKEETDRELDRISKDPRSKEYDEEVIQALIKQKKYLSSFRQDLLNKNLSDLRRYLRITQHGKEIKRGV